MNTNEDSEAYTNFIGSIVYPYDLNLKPNRNN